MEEVQNLSLFYLRSLPPKTVFRATRMRRFSFAVDFELRICLNWHMAEKSLNELPRELRMLFTKGNDALQRENYDYAIDLFNQVLQKEPFLYDCRKALRTAQLRKAGTG